jgi:ATP-dependent protease HslVU (ClpYQ) peptidase subunit
MLYSVLVSIIVSVKIHDGVVMAADSAATFFRPDGQAGQIYQNANKVLNLVKRLPIGVMTCGAGGVGPASIATLLKDLRARIAGDDPAWRVEANECTMEQVTAFTSSSASAQRRTTSMASFTRYATLRDVELAAERN